MIKVNNSAYVVKENLCASLKTDGLFYVVPQSLVASVPSPTFGWFWIEVKELRVS